MAQRKIKWFGVATLACAAALCAGFGAANVTADAASTMNGFAIEYTSVRLGDGSKGNPSGLRFKVDLPENVAKADVTNAYTTVSFTAADGESYTTNVEATVWRNDGSGWNTVLLDIPKDDYATEITAQAFMTVDGVEYETAENTSSIAKTARAAIKEGVATMEQVGEYGYEVGNVTFDLGENKTGATESSAASTAYTETVSGYTLTFTTMTNAYSASDASGNSCFKLGTSSKVGTIEFSVPENVVQVKFYVTGRQGKAGAVSINNAAPEKVNTLSNNSEYTVFYIDVTPGDTVTISSAANSGEYRLLINTIEFQALVERVSAKEKAEQQATKLAASVTKLKISSATAIGEYDALPTIDGAEKVEWFLKEASTYAKITADGKLNVLKIPEMDGQDQTLKLYAVVTAKVNNATATAKTAELFFIIVAPKTPSTDPVTASKTIAELIAQYGWTSSTTKQSFTLDDVVSVKVNGGSNSGKAYDSDHIRIYATDNPAGSLTISLASGYELVSVKISTKTGTYAFLKVNGSGDDICNDTTAVSGSSVVLTSVKNGDSGKQVQVTAIEVTYKQVG